jgi:serralysin
MTTSLRIVFGVLVTVGVLLNRPLQAADYYVAKNGSDKNPCTATAPCLTIAKGVSIANRPGDNVIVKAGTYVESVYNWNSGAAGKPITVKAASGDSVIWQSSNQDKNSLNGAISIANQSFIRIEGFHFDSTVTKSTIRVRADDKATHPVVGIEILNNAFTNNGNNGTSANGQSRMIYLQNIGNSSSYSGPNVNSVSGNRFDGNYGCDLWLIGSNDTHIADNTSVNLHSSQTGADNGFGFIARSIHLGGGSSRNLVEGNDISDMSKEGYAVKYAAAGLRLDAGASNNILQNNVIHDLDFGEGGRGSSGIYNESGCDYNLFQDNVVYNIGGSGLRDGSAHTNAPVGSRWIHNTIYNTKVGLALVNSKSSLVENNRFIDNEISQIYITDKSVAFGGHVFRTNDYFNSATDKIANWNDTAGLIGWKPANLTLEQWLALTGEIGATSARIELPRMPEPTFPNLPPPVFPPTSPPTQIDPEPGARPEAPPQKFTIPKFELEPWTPDVTEMHEPGVRPLFTIDRVKSEDGQLNIYILSSRPDDVAAAIKDGKLTAQLSEHQEDGGGNASVVDFRFMKNAKCAGTGEVVMPYEEHLPSGCPAEQISFFFALDLQLGSWRDLAFAYDPDSLWLVR